MKNVKTITTGQAAAVEEQGAHVAPEKASSKKCASLKRGAPEGKKKVEDRHAREALAQDNLYSLEV